MKPSLFKTAWFCGLFLTAGLAFERAHAQTGGILREVFSNISGEAVANLTNAPAFPNSPSLTEILTDAIETPQYFGDNYGQRIHGFLMPPMDGFYVFGIASDDQSVMNLSRDDNPAHKEEIASVNGYTGFREWDREASQTSRPIRLTAGKLYYFEVLMKEGGGEDHLSTRWELPDGTTEEPIPAWRFFPANAVLKAPQIYQQPTNTVVAEGDTAIFRVVVSNLDPMQYQWQRDGRNIPGATFSSWTNRMVSASDNGAKFRCVIANSLGVTNSAEVRLSVFFDRVPPAVSSLFNIGTRTVRVTFSEPVLSGGVLTNYSLDRGVTISAVTATANPRIYDLTTSPLVLRTRYVLNVQGVTDTSFSRNVIPPGTAQSFVTAEYAPEDIGDPLLVGSQIPVANGFSLVAAGRGIGGNQDQFLFSYQIRNLDFDLKVRLAALDPVDPWSQAGLMARENLTPSSRFAAVLGTPNVSGCFFTYRQTNNANAVRTGQFPSVPPSTWLRLQRQGDMFYGYAGFDGNTWSLLGSVRLPMTNMFYLGLAVSSRSTNEPTTAVLSDLGNIAGVPPLANASDGLELLGPSSRRTGLVISEIMYHPLPRTDPRDLEYVEVFNADSVELDLSAYRLTGAIDYTFPSNTWLASGGFLVVAKSPADVESVYGIRNVHGPYRNRLENLSGTVELRNALGAVLLAARYSGESPWPAAADGAGHSLVLEHPSFGEGHSMAWGPSRQIGGSPGRLEPQTDSPLDSVRINEFLAHTDLPSVDFVELYNHNPTPLDLSGCVLTDNPQKSRFVIPAGTVIPAGGFFVFNENQLGFALDARGEAIFLIHPQRNRILDAVRFGAQANGVATGRYPDGETSLHELLEPTPGKANAALLQRQVVINEVLYNPISGDNEDEFVELYNPSAEAISLGGWRLVDGIDFTFPEEAVLPAKGYAVVTRNASRFLLQHTNLDASVVWGNFGGSLANDGERLALAMPQWMTVTNADQTITPFRAYVTVDEVTYGEGGRWGRWSDGGGSSLELVDARADNRQAANWADSDETAKAAWTPVEATGLLDHGMDDYGINTLQVILMNEGECLVDNVEVIGPGGQNLVANSTFEGGVSDLLFRGTHKQSTLQNGGGINNSRCLHIRASARGDTGPNQVTLPLTTALTPGTMVTLRAQVRWLKGNPEVLLRLRGNFLEAAGHLNLPENPGTPGARNSRMVINIGPAIYQVQHNPILPQAGQPVLVTARAQDPDGVASMVLQYRYDPAVTVHRVVMLDNGTAGDRIAGDGVYSGLIPGQPAGTLIAFSIQARDGFVPAAIAMFPQDAPVRECLVRYGEVQPIGNFGTYRIWFTQATADEWSSRERGSNEPLDATFVYGNSRVIYNMGALYSGSPWHWTGYNSPTGSLCNYQLIMPADDLFLGTTDFVLNAPSNLGSDRTGIRERLTHFMAEQIGLPSTYRRFVHCYVNGLRRSFIFEDVQQPSREFVEQWYPDNAEGELFKIEDWFEYNDEAQGFSNIDATLDNFTTLNGRKKLERYRWMWRKRAVRDSAHDYQRLFDLVDAVNTQDPDHYTQAVHSQVDIEQWMKTMAVRHAVGDWDSYGYQRGKNMFAYRDANLRWVLMNWDISFALGLGDGPGHDVFDTTHSDNITIDQITDRMFKHPPFRRLYLQALAELAKKSFSPGPAIDYMTAHNQALANNSITVESLSSVNAWINSRRAYLDRVISTNQADFEVVYEPIPANPQDKNLVRLRGSAPLEVKTLEVNGIPVALDWNTTTAWTLALPVQGGANLLEIRGIDGSGNVVAGSTTNLTIEYPGLAEKPQDRLVINEIMYEAEIPGAEFVEVHNLSSTYFFDLSDFYFDGVDFTFPPGSLISPQGYLLIVQNRQVFEALYGANLPIAGQFSGRLNNAGEILRLYQPGGTTDSPILIDEVTYASQPPWPVQADTTGSSLQLQDPTQDNNRVGNWTAVDTNGMAPPRWQYVSLTGKPAASNIDLSLNGPGQVYIDHLILVKGLIPESGANLIRDGEFELPLGSHWQATEDHAGSDTVHSPRYSGDLCLRLTALGPNGAVRQSLQQALDPNEFYSLSYWYLPGQGTAMASVGIEGLGLTSTHSVQPELAARRTPGTANSVRKTLGPLPTLWLNEVLSENTRGLPDAAGEREPWIELFNSGIRPVNLEGFYLSSSFSDLSLWEFPAGTLIQPGQFLVVIADGQSTQSIPGQPHTSFRLSPVAGQLALSRLQNGNLVVVDYLEYASQAPNQSYGCYPDGQSHNRFVFASPTPGASNLEVADVPAVRINEWMADNTGTIADPADGGFEDWIEIHNGGVGAIDLGGYSLTDDLGNPTKWSFPDGTLLAPNGLLLIWADEETEQNDLGLGLHVNFKLSRGGEEIGLFDPRGNRVDSVEFGMQATDISEGRFPDGSDHIRSLQEPSPGKSNGGGEGELRVDRIAVSPAGVTLFFTTTPGRTYVVQHKDEITAPNWINLADPFVAVSTETSATDPLPQSSTQRYYRVLEIQP